MVRIRTNAQMIVNGMLQQVGWSFRISAKSRKVAVFKCDCGSNAVLRWDHVKTGHTQSCGCLPITHGHTKNSMCTPTYKTWSAMHARCDAKEGTHHWKYYGSKGITVCERWADFSAFLEDMGERPAGHTIDRVKGHLGYSRENCRWATKYTQARNVSDIRILTFNGESMCMKDWSRHIDIPYITLWNRINVGWSVERALTTPSRQSKTNK